MRTNLRLLENLKSLLFWQLWQLAASRNLQFLSFSVLQFQFSKLKKNKKAEKFKKGKLDNLRSLHFWQLWQLAASQNLQFPKTFCTNHTKLLLIFVLRKGTFLAEQKKDHKG